ncbi:MAG: hypothetical protein ACOYLQ_09625 [Hyphomicrobiaceae bacterium]
MTTALRTALRSHIGPPEPNTDRAAVAEIRRLRKLGWSRTGIARHLALHQDYVDQVIGLMSKGGA